MRLTHLPEHSQRLLAEGRISSGHARALLAVQNPDAVADHIVDKGLTVRDVEKLGENLGKTRRTAEIGEPDADTLTLQETIGLVLGAKVVVRHAGESGEIRIRFQNFEQLDDFCRRLCQPLPP